MSTTPRKYYVIAAIIAAELNQTLSYCKAINLTASNAQAASIRAGSSALGFKALTQFIDELASYTKKAAISINLLARQTCLLATQTARSQHTLQRLQLAQQKANHYPHGSSILPATKRNQDRNKQLIEQYQKLNFAMLNQLEELHQQLRAANVLASICRIEACRVDEANQATFNGVAQEVDKVAKLIQIKVEQALNLFNQLEEQL